ncbi:multidrug ABC transporter permease [Planobispora takensis]|uniref:Multidrug ABC transporter permease n=2 Tax=Planobispora takensis TaxID=1367882 RepID=A0A8J3WVN9_9ACTN|nr:multidrug ABC transporter permease [Planobispora takensis]
MTGAAVRMMSLVCTAAPLPFLGYLITTVIGAVCPVALAWSIKLVLDRLTQTGMPGPVVGLVVGAAALGVVGGVLPQAGGYLLAEMGRRSGLQAKDRLFAAVETFKGLGRFEDPVFLDRLRLAQQSASATLPAIEASFQAVRSTVTMVGFIGSLAVISPWFTACVVMAGVPAFLVERRLSHRRASVMWKVNSVMRRELFYVNLLSTVDTAKEIRLFGVGAFLRERMNRETRAANAEQRRFDQRELLVQGALTLLATALSGAGLLWMVLMAARGRFSVGDVTMFVAASGGVQAGVNGLVTALASGHQQLLLFGHYLAVADAEPDLAVPARPRALPPLRRGIELRDVWFRYSDAHPWVLRGVNLVIDRGTTLALVGQNGSGKSTLVKLLCRFYDPTRGRILWDGVDLREVPVEDLRARLGVVFQDFVSYDMSAADNIALGDLSALGNDERIETAARRAGMHETLQGLPRGYETTLSRMYFGDVADDDLHTGVVLSGGQWQRLALARAFLRQERDMMILDEPSAGLDAAAEHEIHTRLRAVREGRTSLLISHRLGTVREADTIAVLENGMVTEVGDHRDLVASGGTYARLFMLQAAGYGDEPDLVALEERS